MKVIPSRCPANTPTGWGECSLSVRLSHTLHSASSLPENSSWDEASANATAFTSSSWASIWNTHTHTVNNMHVQRGYKSVRVCVCPCVCSLTFKVLLFSSRSNTYRQPSFALLKRNTGTSHNTLASLAGTLLITWIKSIYSFNFQKIKERKKKAFWKTWD